MNQETKEKLANRREEILKDLGLSRKEYSLKIAQDQLEEKERAFVAEFDNIEFQLED